MMYRKLYRCLKNSKQLSEITNKCNKNLKNKQFFLIKFFTIYPDFSFGMYFKGKS